MEKIKLTLVGNTPLIMHADITADPLHHQTIELRKYTGNKKKTEADHNKIAELEWLACLYLNEQEEICMPAGNIFRMLIEALRRRKLGKKGEASVFFEGLDFKFKYDGPTNLNELYADKQFVFRKSVG